MIFLKSWLTDQAQLVAIIALPEDLFAQGAQSKTIFVCKEGREKGQSPLFIHLLAFGILKFCWNFKENFQIGVKNMKSSINFDIIVENA